MRASTPTRLALAAAGVTLLAMLASPPSPQAQGMEDDNPAVLWSMRGEELWSTPAGPRQASLEDCDLGLGPGVVAGAYAQLPRYFEDSGKVEDLESRIVTCRMSLQGMTREQAEAGHFSVNGEDSDMEALVTFLVEQSQGVAMNAPSDHPAEQAAYAMGKDFFYFRSGPHDFGCVTCHSQDGLRIRLQTLPNLAKPGGAAETYPSWPAYRVSQGTVRSMQHRLSDCLRQQRLPPVAYNSDLLIALTTYLAQESKGAPITAPGLKR
ncbi:MAG: sulfur oxidation c-type cytochrome SoxA [Steroidobacteraceae bacterium]